MKDEPVGCEPASRPQTNASKFVTQTQSKGMTPALHPTRHLKSRHGADVLEQHKQQGTNQLSNDRASLIYMSQYGKSSLRSAKIKPNGYQIIRKPTDVTDHNAHLLQQYHRQRL